jgi:hypothetical protein
MQYSPTYMLPESMHNQALLQFCSRIVHGAAFHLKFIAIMVAFVGKICDGTGSATVIDSTLLRYTSF